ncbi:MULTISPECIES: dihydrolipoamide acetyltransferase family protein [Streptomycetaceae]|nr:MULTISPECIES: dihydrolipoamide acetyltransferase family protein [Streptomycetaceae]MYS59979.1 2-oxo acid dehydrogenase subunit E2 [Streptomyces sp. SID5468]CCB75751.1 Dihydrolipoyllysine-residue acetyltransferase component of pyruvate dehydrogenase complex [Streptantibioticus cattleyicolor NRRL 8057 = DSM 46488]
MTATGQRFREFRMPDVGEGLTEAEILKWYVTVGDTVTDGQTVCEVETAKAAVELPIPFDGVVSEIRFPEGTTVDVGTPVIVVDTEPGAGAPAESAPEPAEPEPAPEPEPEPAQPKRQAVLVGYGVAASSTKRRPRKQQPQGAPAPVVPDVVTKAAGPGGQEAVRPLAKPPVRKLAKDLGVDLAAVVPTGPDGTVTREDVRAAARPEPAGRAQAPEPAEVPQAPAPAPSAVEPGARETRVPVKGVRKATAQAMVASAFTAPHVTEFVTFDITRTMRLVQELKGDPAFAGLKVSPLLLVAKALLVAVKRNPQINAAWDEERQEIVHKHYVNLGIAAATPRGLIVPNIKDAHDKTLPQLAAALGDLVTTAREGRTSPADMQGGTLTITNVGVFGVDTGTPILNPGESAILAFGAVKEQPWVHKGKVKPRQVTTLALSFDHRLVDGELGSKVLADVAAVLEQPKRLMTWA